MGRDSYKNLKFGLLFNPVFALQHCKRRKRTINQVADKLGIEKRIKTKLNGLNTMPDDILVSILSYLPIEEAARTSVLSHKWRYLWQSVPQSLEFSCADIVYDTEEEVLKEEVLKMIARIDQVVKVYQGSEIDKFIVKVTGTPDDRLIDNWVDFVIRKKVKRLELKVSVGRVEYDKYNFPDLKTLLSSHSQSPLLSLRIFQLENVNVKEEVVHYFVASCPYLEELCVNGSDYLKNLKITGPLPYFKRLEISNCGQIQSIELSAKNLVTALYDGEIIDVPFENVPNLTELTLGGKYIKSLLSEPNKHSSYSDRLEKLVLKMVTMGRPRLLYVPLVLPQLHSLKQLEVEIGVAAQQAIFFFLLLIKAAPLLRRFRMKIFLIHPYSTALGEGLLGYPDVSASDATGFVHEHLKVVEMNGYIGTFLDIPFLLHLVKIAPSLETIVMDPRDIINCDYYYGRDKDIAAANLESAKDCINDLRETLPPQIQIDEIE